MNATGCVPSSYIDSPCPWPIGCEKYCKRKTKEQDGKRKEQDLFTSKTLARFLFFFSKFGDGVDGGWLVAWIVMIL